MDTFQRVSSPYNVLFLPRVLPMPHAHPTPHALPPTLTLGKGPPVVSKSSHGLPAFLRSKFLFSSLPPFSDAGQSPRIPLFPNSHFLTLFHATLPALRTPGYADLPCCPLSNISGFLPSSLPSQAAPRVTACLP